MDYRMPLQHLLHKLWPTVGPAEMAAPAHDFEDTRPDDSRARQPAALRRTAPTRQPLEAKSQSTIDLVLGSEIMELPDDTSNELMDEFFAGSPKRPG